MKKFAVCLGFMLLVFSIVSYGGEGAGQPKSASPDSSSNLVEQAGSDRTEGSAETNGPAADREGIIGLADLNDELLEDEITVSGIITFIQKSEEGLYFEVEQGDDFIGVGIDLEILEQMSEETTRSIANGNNIYVTGILQKPDAYFLAVIDLKAIEINETWVQEMDPVLAEYLVDDWILRPQNLLYGISEYQAIEAMASILVDYRSMDISTDFAERVHNLGMKYGVFIGTMAVEEGEDVLPETHAKDIDGNSFSEHIGVWWPVHSTAEEAWKENIQDRVHNAIDAGVDIVILDDDDATAFFAYTGADENIGDFSQANMDGFRDYLRSKYNSQDLEGSGISSIEDFNYATFLKNQGWDTESILEIIVKNYFFSDLAQPLIVPLWKDFRTYTSKQTSQFMTDLIADGRSYAESKGKEVVFTPYPNDLTHYQTYEMDNFDIYDVLAGETHFLAYAGFPPRGRAACWHKLGYSILGLPRYSKHSDCDGEMYPFIEWQPSNLLRIRYAETFAHRGAVSTPVEFFTMYTDETYILDKEAPRDVFSFVAQNGDFFDTRKIDDLSRVLVLYSPESLRADRNGFLPGFIGVSSMLDRLHVQYDAALTSRMPDTDKYDLIILPHVISEDDEFGNAILDFIESGGSVIYFNASPEDYPDPDYFKRFTAGVNNHGDGIFYRYQNEGDFKNFYDWQVYDQDIIDLLEWEDEVYVATEDAEEAFQRFRDAFNQLLPEGMVVSAPESVGIQIYKHADGKLLVHAINYNYELTQDEVIAQENIDLRIKLDADPDIDNVRMISYDHEDEIQLEYSLNNGYLEITIPRLYIWSVIIIE